MLSQYDMGMEVVYIQKLAKGMGPLRGQPSLSRNPCCILG
jgi:hypothetical protein